MTLEDAALWHSNIEESPKIVFRGELSRNSLKYQRKKFAKMLIIVTTVSNFVVGSIVVIFALLIDLLILWFLAVMILMSFICFVILPVFCKKAEVYQCDIEFYDNDMVIRASELDNCECRYYSDIKKIIDFGEGYYFVFNRLLMFSLCQKDLIEKGTKEEFEKMFASYIVKE